ncbi:MAG: UvrD-helicase domain-containing protein [Candidatus Paceibacterota bacterium]|jgi:DNA helicase-2/ATP-dependent DNA helicase PcrA
MKISGELNPAQEKAANHKDGPLLIIAGAGAGKTKTISHRILNLVKSGIEPSQILAITFTNKAAKEMKERTYALLKKERALLSGTESQPFMSTFHSLGIYILRENAQKIGLTRHFSIFDQDDSLSAIKEALKESNLDPKQFEPGRIKNIISRYKGDMITQSEYAAEAEDYFPKIVAGVWAKYERILEKEGGLDFDDLILRAVKLLQGNKDVLEYYQNRWLYIHIDEYQDTNASQYQFSRLLSQKNKNICVVGDSDQNIYGWRGANLRNLLNFEKDYPGATVILLEENYRSTKTILEVANTVIRKNKVRKEKNLFTKNIDGEKVSIYAAYDESDEAKFIAEKSKSLILSGVPEQEIAVLYRANFQSRALEEAFLSTGVPYQVLGTKFFERKEVKDILSYIRASLNEKSLSDLKRILNVPSRGIGPATIAKIFAGQESALSGAMREKISSFRKILADINAVMETKKTSEAVRFAIKRTGIEEMLMAGGDEDKERFENLMEMVTLATRYDIHPGKEGVEKLLDDAALASDQDSLDHINNKENKKNAVRLMTVHASKGLEFGHVFITGLEADLFPHRRINNGNVSEEQSEEERRLFYVALTRAKKKLYLTFTEVRTIFGSRQINAPSEFLGDIAHDLVQFEERENSIHRVVYLD